MSAELHPSRTGRPLGFDRDHALDKMMTAFWAGGASGATTEALESATGLSRSSIRNTFGSKEQLLLAALDRYLDLVDDVLVGPMRSGGAGLDDVERFFEEMAERKAAEPGSHGCLVVNLAAEVPDPTSPVAARLARYHEMLGEGFRAALARAARRGEISPQGLEDRVEVLRGLAVAINWTARAAGPEAAVALTHAARQTVQGWRTGPAR